MKRGVKIFFCLICVMTTIIQIIRNIACNAAARLRRAPSIAPDTTEDCTEARIVIARKMEEFASVLNEIIFKRGKEQC